MLLFYRIVITDNYHEEPAVFHYPCLHLLRLYVLVFMKRIFVAIDESCFSGREDSFKLWRRIGIR